MRFRRDIIPYVYRFLPYGGKIHKPVFILGCGRSGTTILGKLIKQHTDVFYLWEPRDIWFLDPQTDVWTQHAHSRRGKLWLDERDVRPHLAKRIKRAFWLNLKWHRKRQFVEKLPVNSFRIRYLRKIFPDARLILILRNGAEVARSIENLVPRRWFGENDYKWFQLVKIATERGERELVQLCDGAFSRGLLEWRLSVQLSLEDLRELSDERRLEVRYEDLVETPQDVISTIEEFIELPYSFEMRRFAKEIYRKTPTFNMTKLTSAQLRIAGDLLKRLKYL